MMKKIMLLIALLLLCAPALAQGESAPAIPAAEVQEHIAAQYPGYLLEDYCEVDTLDALYGFALLTQGEARMLVGYREKSGKLVYWMKTHNGVPQGSQPAWFTLYERGQSVFTFVDTDYIADGNEFSVTQLDELGESYDDSVMFRYDGKGRTFRLISYKRDIVNTVWIEDGALAFGGINNGLEGRVKGEIQTDIRFVNFSVLPKTVGEARYELTDAPELEHGVLKPKEIRFSGGRNYPVYTGPGAQFVRSGGGKGAVSTNDWIQVFGRLGGWIMVQYDISVDRYRIGWIEASALPSGAQVEDLSDLGVGLEQTYFQDVQVPCVLTDDPFNSQTQIVQLPKGTLSHG